MNSVLLVLRKELLNDGVQPVCASGEMVEKEEIPLFSLPNLTTHNRSHLGQAWGKGAGKRRECPHHDDFPPPHQAMHREEGEETRRDFSPGWELITGTLHFRLKPSHFAAGREARFNTQAS